MGCTESRGPRGVDINIVCIGSVSTNFARFNLSMFWPVVLPFQITCCVLFIAVIVLAVYGSPESWSRTKAYLVYSVVALVAFVPSCSGIMMAVDAFRFGDFSYASYDDIRDFRSQRYLPELATDIQMRNYSSGYVARYKLSSDEFNLYLDKLWEKYGEDSALERGELFDEGEPVEPGLFYRTFDGLGWDCPANGIVHHSPTESDGGGAKYFVDSDSGLVYQRTGFW